MRHYTFLTPLNRLVDATPPESDPAREFGALAAKWQTNATDLRSRLAPWRDNRTRVMPLLRSSVLLQEAVPLADEVSAVANAGLEALDYLESKRPPAPDWIDRQRALLKDAAKPRAELLIAIVPGVTKLVDAAAAVHEDPRTLRRIQSDAAEEYRSYRCSSLVPSVIRITSGDTASQSPRSSLPRRAAANLVLHRLYAGELEFHMKLQARR